MNWLSWSTIWLIFSKIPWRQILWAIILYWAKNILSILCKLHTIARHTQNCSCISQGYLNNDSNIFLLKNFIVRSIRDMRGSRNFPFFRSSVSQEYCSIKLYWCIYFQFTISSYIMIGYGIRRMKQERTYKNVWGLPTKWSNKRRVKKNAFDTLEDDDENCNIEADKIRRVHADKFKNWPKQTAKNLQYEWVDPVFFRRIAA